MKHEFDCYCIKCQQEDVPERTGKLVVTAVIGVLAWLPHRLRVEGLPGNGRRLREGCRPR